MIDKIKEIAVTDLDTNIINTINSYNLSISDKVKYITFKDYINTNTEELNYLYSNYKIILIQEHSDLLFLVS